MSWELGIAVASAAIATASALAAFWQASEARKARTDANTSAVDAAEAQQRIAQAIERLNPPRSASWEVNHVQGDQYALTNVGGETALAVRVVTDSFHQPESYFPRIQDRSQELIWYAGKYGANRQIRVTWVHLEDTNDVPHHEWIGVIPSKPK